MIARKVKPNGYSGMGGVCVLVGPPGSFIVPVESAVSVSVITVLVESSVAKGNCVHAPP